MFTASANTRPSRFVKISGNYTVEECNSGDLPYGISDAYGESAPIPSQSTEYVASSGSPVPVIVPGDSVKDRPCLLILGSGGATAGVLLKSDNEGAGVAVASNNDIYGAQALEAGSAGEAIRVKPMIGFYGA